MINEDSLFLDRSLILKINFDQFNLTYIPSDTGPEDAIYPNPVLINPVNGLWIIDPGMDRSSWRLIGFDLNGNMLVSVNLVEQLDLQKPQEFLPFMIESINKRDISILASKEFDYSEQLQENYYIFTFTSEGKLLSELSLPKYRYDWRTFIFEDGNILNLEKEGPCKFWFLYKKGEKNKLFETEFNNTWVKTSNVIIENISQNTKDVKIISSNGQVNKPSRIEQFTSTNNTIKGDGPFFGYITLHEINTIQRGNKEFTQQPRSLELFYFKQEDSAILNFGSTFLSPIEYESKNNSDFILYQYEQSCFDIEGNLYEIAWTSSELIVYRYSLNKSLFDQFLENIKEKK